MLAILENGYELRIKKDGYNTLYYTVYYGNDVIETGYTDAVNLELYYPCEDYFDYVLTYCITDEEIRCSKIEQRIYTECIWNIFHCCNETCSTKCNKYVDHNSELGVQLYKEYDTEQHKVLMELQNKWKEKFNEYGGEN